MNMENDYACHLGDHAGWPHCPNCGYTNWQLLAWLGAIGRWAKAWGVSKDEAEDRIIRHQIARDIKAGKLTGVVEDYL